MWTHKTTEKRRASLKAKRAAARAIYKYNATATEKELVFPVPRKFSLERTSERRQAVEKIKGINLTQLKSNLLPSNAHIMSRFLRRGAVGVFSLRGIVWALCQQKWLFFWESKHDDANGRQGKTNPFGQVCLFEGSVIICLTDFFFHSL